MLTITVHALNHSLHGSAELL